MEAPIGSGRRKIEYGLKAAMLGRIEGQPPVIRLRQVADDRQPEAGSGLRFIEPCATFADLCPLLCGEAGSVILDGDR